MPQWSLTDNSETPGAVGQSSKQENGTATPSSEILGIPISLMPYYVAFMLDAIAIGLVMPVLPFTIIELGASAFQLSLVVSANYIAQSLGVILMGRISDYYGRRIVMLICLAASAASYVSLSNSYSLLGIALSRIISGSFGGLLPVMQSTVADVASPIDRPKYLGRIVAVFGLGFVIGPAFSSLMSSYRTRQKILVAAALPFIGWLIIYFFGRETKQVFITQSTAIAASSVHSTPKVCKLPTTSKTGRPTSHSPQVVSFDVMLLVINGFCIMYAFATETIYAMFMKDIFGYGEDSLSLLFVSNGVFIGIFQVFFIKPLIVRLGKHATLAFGSMLLSIGMCGFALIRHQVLHFVLFTIHIIGYSIADTTLASLISTYSSAMNQGRNLSYNQAAQSCARVVGPLLAGFLYEYDKDMAKPTSPASTVLVQSSSPVMLPLMPQGSLPFVAGAMLPAFAVFIPLYLYMKEMPLKRKIGGEIDLESKCGDVDYYD